MATVVEERRFSKFDAEGRNNKFWNITLYDNGDVEVHFGPQGKSGQRKTHSSPHVKSGRDGFDKQIKAKLGSRKGYTENEVLEGVKGSEGGSSSKHVAKSQLKQKAVTDIAGGNPELATLIQYFADVNAHNIYEASGGKITYDVDDGLFKTAQGVVSLTQIQQARLLLDKIAAFAAKDKFDGKTFFAVVNPYLSLIPQPGLVRQLDFTEMFSQGDSGGLHKQGDILDGLEASFAAVLAKPKDGKKKAVKKDEPATLFKVDLEETKDRKRVKWARDFYAKTKGGHRDVSSYDVRRVFALNIHTMSSAFNALLKSKWDGSKKKANVNSLWHGTKASNMLSILKGGMIIPPSSAGNVTGRMFGDGLYFSDQSTKSLRYATGGWGGGGHTDRKFMFLVDVAMGKPHIPRGSNWHLKIPAGSDSCFAKSGQSGVMNNEMIVYNTAQANPVWLLEFTHGGR